MKKLDAYKGTGHMRNRVIAVVLLGAAWVSAQPLWAQQTPAAVMADPPLDKQHPPSLAILTVPSRGIEMDAFVYLAPGAGPHGTVLLLHGLPGYEINGDLAQSVRRAGWNVFIFHYRGTWGAAGRFSLSSAIEDVAEVVHFLRQPEIVSKYRIDPHLIVLIGHSFGGFLAGYEVSRDREIKAVAMISAVNLGSIGTDHKERKTRLKRWKDQLHPVRGATASQLFAEAERHRKEWNYVQWADTMSTRPVLLVEADDQNRSDMQALAAALRQKGSVALEERAIPTDHSFSDHRIALQSLVVEWLTSLPKNEPRPTR